jgi:hypothetical protein
MTIESIAQTIRRFLHFMATMVVVLLVCYYIALIIAKYGGGVPIKIPPLAFFLIPCLIVALFIPGRNDQKRLSMRKG